MLQPFSISSTASQSSNSGCVGGGALAAEVEDGRRPAAAEVPRPDVIDRDAGRQRVPSVGHPAGQRRTPAGARRRERPAARRLGLQVRLGRLQRAAQRRVRLAGRVERLAGRGDGVAGPRRVSSRLPSSCRRRPGAGFVRRGPSASSAAGHGQAPFGGARLSSQVAGIRGGRRLVTGTIRRRASLQRRRLGFGSGQRLFRHRRRPASTSCLASP